jgi:hypothetical protein
MINKGLKIDPEPVAEKTERIMKTFCIFPSREVLSFYFINIFFSIIILYPEFQVSKKYGYAYRDDRKPDPSFFIEADCRQKIKGNDIKQQEVDGAYDPV